MNVILETVTTEEFVEAIETLEVVLAGLANTDKKAHKAILIAQAAIERVWSKRFRPSGKDGDRP